jgi:hypothetical protein
MVILFFIAISPFNEANFVPLPFRSISLLSNPAGIGINPGAELFLTYHPELLQGGISIGNLGFGIARTDTNLIYEIGGGYKLPGAFAIGYGRQFGDTTENIIGVICIPNQYIRLGYKTNLAHKKFIHTGIGINIVGLLTLACQMNYEGIDDTKDYLFGFILNPSYGVKINFASDQEWNWHIGINLGTSKLNLGLIYSYNTKKFTGGFIISAQSY